METKQELRVGDGKNCKGCKWLDRCKENGRGYCCMVVRSGTQNEKCRTPDMEQSELYEAGDFATRYLRNKAESEG